MSPHAASSAIAHARRTVDYVTLLARDARKLAREIVTLRKRIADLERSQAHAQRMGEY